MLDKSLPWHSFIMSRESGKIPESIVLPKGFPYVPIEMSVTNTPEPKLKPL